MPFTKGHPNYFFHHSKESGEKIRQANLRNGNQPSFKGRKHSEMSKIKMSDSLKGKQLGNQHRKGFTPWNKGTKSLIPAWNKGTKGVMIAWNKGKEVPQQSGEKHWAWKGGNSSNYRTGYYSLKYKNWRRKVFERDSFTCQGCGGRGYVTAHHIKSFAHYPKLRFEVKNGLTLCEFCHSLTDNYKGRAKMKDLTK